MRLAIAFVLLNLVHATRDAEKSVVTDSTAVIPPGAHEHKWQIKNPISSLLLFDSEGSRRAIQRGGLPGIVAKLGPFRRHQMHLFPSAPKVVEPDILQMLKVVVDFQNDHVLPFEPSIELPPNPPVEVPNFVFEPLAQSANSPSRT